MNVPIYTTPHQTIVRSVEPNCSSAGQRKIRDRIHSFRDLAHGWHYGEGRGATEIAVEAALTIQHHFLEHGISEIEVFPDLDGGILVSGYHEQHTVDVFCTPDGHTDLLHEVDDKAVYERNDVPMDEIVDYLGGLLWRTKKSFDSFITENLAIKSNDLRALHLRTRPPEAYQSLTLSVLRNAAERNVSIYDDSTLRYQEILSSFGDCIPPISQKKLASNTNFQLLVTTVT